MFCRFGNRFLLKQQRFWKNLKLWRSVATFLFLYQSWLAMFHACRREEIWVRIVIKSLSTIMAEAIRFVNLAKRMVRKITSKPLENADAVVFFFTVRVQNMAIASDIACMFWCKFFGCFSCKYGWQRTVRLKFILVRLWPFIDFTGDVTQRRPSSGESIAWHPKNGCVGDSTTMYFFTPWPNILYYLGVIS